MKHVFSILRLDTRLILRDKIIWYVLFFPAIIAVILLFVSGRMSDNTPTLAIGPDVPQTAMTALDRVAILDIQSDESSLLKRVNAFDNVAGILWEDGAARVIFQGNEGAEYQEQTAVFIESALNKRLPDVQLVNTNMSRSFIVQVIIAALLMAPAVVGGTVSGFLIADEKENKLIRGYQIAPLRFSTYIGSRSLLAAGIGLISMVSLCFICGAVNKMGSLLFILFCSLPLFGVITILFGSIAKDKISCIAMFKILVIIFLVLPLTSAFVPSQLQGIFFPLPMYWQFQSVFHVLNGALNMQYCGITFVSGMLLLALVSIICRNKIQKI